MQCTLCACLYWCQGDFATGTLPASATLSQSDVGGSWNGGIPEQLCSGHRPVDHRRKLYPFTTATEEGCATHRHADKGHEIKKEKVPEWHTDMRWEHSTAARSVRQRRGLTIMVSTWMNSCREASCVSLNSLRMLKRSTSLLDTMMRISALSSVPRPWGEWGILMKFKVANFNINTKTRHNLWFIAMNHMTASHTCFQYRNNKAQNYCMKIKGKYLHGFVQPVCKVWWLVLYTANCRAKRWRTISIVCPHWRDVCVLGGKVRNGVYRLQKRHSSHLQTSLSW